MKLGLAPLLLAASLPLSGCAAFASTAVAYAPIVADAACALAADQGAAEPGWEVYVCEVIDPKSGAPVAGSTFELHCPKGSPPTMLAKTAAR